MARRQDEGLLMTGRAGAVAITVASLLGCSSGSVDHRPECERWVTRWMEGPPGMEREVDEELRSIVIGSCVRHPTGYRLMHECLLHSSTLEEDERCALGAERELMRRHRVLPWGR
jgi:hypothetical protein